MSIYEIAVKQANGQSTTLEQYKNQTLLIVNVASRCGFTKQYKPLEELHRKYKEKGLVVLGFPCNQFLNQEPGDNAKIQKFAHECFQVTFPIFAKIDVKGSNQAPIYKYLQENITKKPLIPALFIPWNFTKILVSPEGIPIKRFLPTTSLKNIEKTIKPLIGIN